MCRKITLLFLLVACTFYGRAQLAVHDSIAVFKVLDSVFTATVEDQPGSVGPIMERQERIAQQLKTDSLLIKVAMNRGQTMEVVGLTDIALKEYFNAIRIAEKAGLHWYAAKLLFNIGHLYERLGDMERSTSYFNNSKSEYLAGKHYKDTVLVNYELGFNMVTAGKVDKGITIIKQNIEAARKAGNNYDVVVGLDNLANVVGGQGDNKQCLKYLLEAATYQDVLNSSFRKAILNEHLAETYAKLGDWSKTQHHLDTAFYYAKQIKSRDWLVDAYLLQATVYEATGKPAQALAAHKKFADFKDSMFSESYTSRVAAMTSIYELDKKQTQIQLLTKDNQLIAEKVERQNFQRKVWIGGSALAIALVAMGLLARTQRRIRKMQVSFSHALLDAQETEKQRISRELHDSVGQNILFVKNQLARSEDPEAKILHDTIATTIDEVRSISKDLYPNQLDKYGLAASVDALAEKVQQATGIFMSSDLQAVDELLNKQVRVSIYRIIQEAINNVVKHAQARAIRVTGAVEQNKAVITIMDNGHGFDTSVLEQKASRSFGVLNMEERARMLGGKMTLQSSSSGTKIIVTIPLQS